MIGGLVGGIAVSLLGVFAMSRSRLGEDGVTWIVSVLVGVATFAIVAFFGCIMPARTITGARTRDKLRGFEEFLSQVEKYRLEVMPLTPELFEKVLPYAIALGVQRRWAAAFADICTQPPIWYVSTSPHTMFDTDDVTYQLGSITNSTAAAMTSAPRSSGDSGFGISSFGGGDFGGGGGRWWLLRWRLGMVKPAQPLMEGSSLAGKSGPWFILGRRNSGVWSGALRTLAKWLLLVIASPILRVSPWASASVFETALNDESVA